MLVALLWGLIAAAEIRGGQPVVVNAVYSNKAQLVPTFGVYYGTDCLQMVRVELDFAISQIVMMEDLDFSSDGIDCSPEFGCRATNQVEYISDSRGARIFPTVIASVPIRLPFANHLEVTHNTDLQFNLYRQGKMRVRNVIGLAPKSNFWPYISRRFGQSCFKVSFYTDFKMRNVDEILEFPEEIFTKVIFFDDSEFATSGYREVVTDSLAFTTLNLSFPGFGTVPKDPTFNLEQPFYFRVCRQDYQILLDQVKTEICPDPNACETGSDMFGNLSGKPKLSFVFPYTDDFHIKTPYRVDLLVSELVYVRKDQKIGYNFGSLGEFEDTYKAPQLELGLLFLNKVLLEVQYTASGRVVLSISDKKYPSLQSVFMTYVIAAAATSVFLTLVFYCCIRGTKKSDTSSYSNSFL